MKIKNILFSTVLSAFMVAGAVHPLYAEAPAKNSFQVTEVIAENGDEAVIEKYNFDKAHTQILFFVNHLGFSMSQGEFLDYDGFFMLDRNNLENSSIDVTIKTASVDMDDEKWDASMRGENFFKVERFPEMTFKSTAVELTGNQTADVTGDLTILGIAKPVTLSVTHNKSDVNPFSKKFIAGFSASATINRSDWGMSYALPGVGDEVEIRLEVEGVRE
jgi:polyisoprenoid-binding protein YceI